MINAGEKLPTDVFKILVDVGMVELTVNQIFATRRVVVFGVHSAFTPGWSRNHLPNDLNRYEEIISKDFQTVACMAMNDALIMNA